MRAALRMAALAFAAMSAPAAAQTAYPAEFLDAVREANTARMIAELCPDIGFSDAAEAEAVESLTRSLTRGGMTGTEVQYLVDNPPVDWLSGKLTEYALANGFDGDAATAGCDAGRAELRRRSGIAAFLVRR